MAFVDGPIGWLVRPAQVEPKMVMVWDKDGGALYYGPENEINVAALQLLTDHAGVDEQGCEHYKMKGGEMDAGADKRES